MTFPEQVEEYLRRLPDMYHSDMLSACMHFGMSRSNFQLKIRPVKFRDLRRRARLERFVNAVKNNPDISAVEATEILGLSDEKSLNKYIKYHTGVTFTQYRQHILDGYYGM